MMKRFVAAFVLAGALGLLAAGGVGAETGIPPCADITDGGGFYGGPDATPPNTVSGSIILAAPSCRADTYTLFIVGYDSTGTSTGLAGVQTFRGDGRSGHFLYSVGGVTAPFVCLFWITNRGAQLYDVAPDAGCPSSFDPSNPPQTSFFLAPDGSPGGGSQIQ